MFLISLILLFVANSLLLVLMKFNIINEFSQKINLPEVSNKERVRFYLYIIPFMIPLLEELSFRLLLTTYNKKFIIYSFALILSFYTYHFLNSYFYVPLNKYVYCFSPYLYIFSISLLYYAIFYFGFKLIRFPINNKVWHNKFHLIFYFSSILFALHHIPTLNLSTNQYFFLPLILLPFFIYAIVLGFIRVKFGLKYSIILHSLYLVPRVLSELNKI